MSVEESNLDPEKIHIIENQIVKCNIGNPLDFSIEKIENYVVDFDFNLGFNLKDLLIKADFKLDIFTESKNEKEAKGAFHFVYIFKIENLNDLAILDEKGKIDLDGNLGNALASITYSTSRGILFATTKGTGLENFTLPVINPNSLLEKKK